MTQSRYTQRRGLSVLRALAWAGLAALLSCAAFAQPAPQPDTGWTPKRPAHGRHFMVTAAHPLAVDAGVAMLRRGGSAVDAAIATGLVLNLVEPEASGIGGGGFLLHYDARNRAVTTYDGRETAPAEATPELFLGADGKPLALPDAIAGGRSVGVPGLLRMYEMAHARYGKLAWATLFEPAIRLARGGFPIAPRVAKQIERSERLKDQPGARDYFFHADGTPLKSGEIVRNPALAEVLERAARGGADAFYEGDIARDIVAAVRNHPSNPGGLSQDDLRRYRAKVREALCRPYRAYMICGMRPPSSGAIAVLQMLGMLQRFDLSAMPPSSVDGVHLLAEAGRLAYADRGAYLADSDFVDVPVEGLLAPAYIAERSALIDSARSMGKAMPGKPDRGPQFAAISDPREAPSTTQISIVDAEGNAVALTQTIEFGFGSRLMVRGFLLNNELTDFSFTPYEDGKPVANRVQPGKRPRSSMSPMFVLDHSNRLVGVVGSPGGSAIINYVAKVLVGVIDARLPLQTALDLGNFGSRNGPTELETGRGLEALQKPLEAMGHEVKLIELNSGVHAVWRDKTGWTGAADPRREGTAKGE